MTPRVFYAPPNPPARRAGNLLLLLGGVALLIGVSMLFRSGDVNSLDAQGPAREALEQIDKTFPFGRQGLFILGGLMMTAYGLGASACGAWVRSANRVALSVTLVLTLLIALFVATAAAVAIAQGAADGAVVPLILCALHGTAARWLLQALARPMAMLGLPTTPWVPMRDYYLPPAPPC